MTNPLASIPAHDRPRERLLRCGADALSERELLAAGCIEVYRDVEELLERFEESALLRG